MCHDRTVFDPKEGFPIEYPLQKLNFFGNFFISNILTINRKCSTSKSLKFVTFGLGKLHFKTVQCMLCKYRGYFACKMLNVIKLSFIKITLDGYPMNNSRAIIFMPNVIVMSLVYPLYLNIIYLPHE